MSSLKFDLRINKTIQNQFEYPAKQPTVCKSRAHLSAPAEQDDCPKYRHEDTAICIYDSYNYTIFSPIKEPNFSTPMKRGVSICSESQPQILLNKFLALCWFLSKSPPTSSILYIVTWLLFAKMFACMVGNSLGGLSAATMV